MKTKLLLFAISTIVSCLSQPLSAITHEIKNLTISNTGTVTLGDNNLTSKKIEGEGTIIADNTLIVAKEFLFSGIFQCNGNCDIFTLTSPENIKMQRAGTGLITIYHFASKS